MDDTEDIQGPRGPLLTSAPQFNASVGIAATARLAARANVNALAVRLALPITAVTDVESMAADALEQADSATAAGGGAGGVGGGIAAVRVGGRRLAGHVLVCGTSDQMGYLLRALASLCGPRTLTAGGGTGVGNLDYGGGATAAASSSSSPEGIGGSFSPFRAGASPAAPPSPTPAGTGVAGAVEEGEQYAVRPQDIVVLAPAKPSDAALNSMYPGSARLLGRVTYLAGSPSEAADLLRAGVLTARAAVVLTTSKPTITADGSDNLSDDSDAIVTAAVIAKLNPGLHVITELLHGAHAAYIRPQGTGLNDAARGALIGILEEREASRQRGKLEEAIKRVAAEREIRFAGGGAHGTVAAGAATRTDVLLSKLYRQHMRLRAAMTGALVFARPAAMAVAGAGAGAGVGAPGAAGGSSGGAYSLSIGSLGTSARGGVGGAGGGAPPAAALSRGLGAAVDALDRAHGASTAGSGGLGGFSSSAASSSVSDADLERVAESGLSHAAIVDVMVGVRAEFGAAGAAMDGGGAAAGASKGSGATADLFAAPAFAAGRVFSLNTMDAIVCEQHFESYIVGVLKQLVRAARRQRFIALPLTEAVVMARLAAHGAPAATPADVAAARAHYLSELAMGIIDTARGSAGAWGPPAQPHQEGPAAAGAAHWADTPVRTYGALFEALLRGWGLLPLGLYRRVHPATGLRVNPQTGAALQLAAGPPSAGGGFVQNRALVSYVFTAPPPDAILSEHDLVYVLLPEAAAGADGLYNNVPDHHMVQ